MTRVLITGGLGYVGGRIAHHLATTGWDVRLTTRRSPQDAPSWAKDLEILRCDLRDPASDFNSLCQGVNAVIHLAAINEIESVRDPAEALLVNTASTLRLLQAAEKNGVAKFVYFSTAHVYRSPLSGLCREDIVTRPGHPYAITHRAAEDYVLASHDAGRIGSVVLRLSNAIGAPMNADVDRWTLLVNDLCRQAVTIGKLVLQTSGTQQRNFIALSDVAAATTHLLDQGLALGDGLFNLGGPRHLSVRQMAERVAQRCRHQMGRELPLIAPPMRPDERIVELDYCTSKLAATGFRWKDDLDHEIDATLQLCRTAFQ